MYQIVILIFVAFYLRCQPSSASGTPPLVGRHAVMPQRRQNCDLGNNVINQDQIISDACNANPQNDYWTCYNQLVVFIRQSAANTCALSYATYNDCLIRNNSLVSACLDSKAGWDGCSNYALDVYKYCGCWYTIPADLYDCANVILEIRPKAITTSTIPTATILSTALLTGPILPASASTSQISVVGASTLIAVVAVEPQPQSTVYQTSTVLVTNCGTSVTNCPVTPSLTSYPVTVSSTLSPPLITPTTIRTLSASSSSVSTGQTTTNILTLPATSSPTSTSKTTSTIVSTTTHTFTVTLTSCPPIVTDCPFDYSSFSTFTSTIVRTSYSCDGGCQHAQVPPPGQVCVQKARTRLAKRGEL